MMFKIFSGIVILIPLIIGVSLLITPGNRLIEKAQQVIPDVTLPMPGENTTGRKILIGFYKSIGIIAILCSAFFAFILFTKT